MKKNSLPALLLIGSLACLAPAHAAIKNAAETEATKEDAAPSAAAKLDLAKLFEGKLFSADGKPAKSDSIKKAKFVAVYHSAHWCGPCRSFTPALVKFVNENRKNDNFEVVLVSSDYSQKNMLGYMSEAKMPWLGVLGSTSPGKEGIINEFRGIKEGVQGIPHLRVYDAEGNIVIDSVKDGKYVGPQYVLSELKKKI